MAPSPRAVRELFDSALDRPESGRAAFVAATAGGDGELRDAVLRLLERDAALAGVRTRTALDALGDELDRALPDPLAPGTRVGAFRIEEEIGRGGMGRVLRAVRVEGDFEQEVAIKLIRRELLEPTLLQRFSNERRVLATMEHPGICRLFDAGALADGTPYVVMEYVRGLPITEHCDARRLGLRERLQLFRRVLAAVSHAHRNLVVHRDLKASNVLVTAEGEPKLLDFGIAKALHPGADGGTATAERYLTPATAAPEQLRGDPVTVACDVYALGALLYELLSGRVPFDLKGRSAGEVERTILTVPPPPLAAVGDADPTTRGFAGAPEWRAALRGDLEVIAQRCLRKAPTERYGTVDLLDVEIAHWLDGRPLLERGSDRWYRARKFVGRHRLAVALVSLLVAVTVAGTISIALQMERVAAERNRAILERDRAQQAVALLRSAFSAADPAHQGGVDASARQVLVGAHAELDRQFEVNPELAVELAGTLAEVELALGMWTEAAELTGQATRLARTSGDPGTARSLELLRARALLQMGDQAGAKEVLDAIEAADDGPSQDLAVVRAQWLARNGSPDAAVGLLRTAVDALASRPPSDDLATTARLQLAESQRMADAPADALATLEQTLAWQRTALDPDHPRVTLTRLNRIDVLRRLDRFDEALVEAQAVLADIERLYGRDSAFAANARTSLGSVLLRLGRYGDAADQYRDALATWRRILGDGHANTLRTAFNLVQLLGVLPDRRAEAHALFDLLLAGTEHQEDPAPIPVLRVRTHLASMLVSEGDAARALEVLTDPACTDRVEAAGPETRGAYMKALEVAVEKATCRRNAGPPVSAARACRTAVDLLESAAASGSKAG